MSDLLKPSRRGLFFGLVAAPAAVHAISADCRQAAPAVELVEVVFFSSTNDHQRIIRKAKGARQALMACCPS